MRIKTMSFETFGPLQNGTIRFHDGFNILTGINGTGKSSVLEAVYELCKHDPQIQMGQLLQRLKEGSISAEFDIQSLSPHTQWHMTFKYVKASNSWLFESQNEFLKKISPNNNIIVTEAHQLKERLSKLRLQMNHMFPPNETISLISAHRGEIQNQSLVPLSPETWRSKRTNERFAGLQTLMRLINDKTGNLERTIDKIHRKFFSTQNKNLVTVQKLYTNKSFLATQLETFENEYELAQAASGVLETLFIVAETATLKNSIILIDEPELHLHPKAQAMMFNYLWHLTTAEGGSNQVIIATHSLSMIYLQTKGKVMNFRHDTGGVKVETIIEDGNAQDALKYALADLGYDEATFKAAFKFAASAKIESNIFNHDKWGVG